MPDADEVLIPLPYPVLTSLCRLIGDRLGADLVLITDAKHEILASHAWPLNLNVPPLAALLTADMLVLTDTTRDPRFEPLADAMGGFRTGFYAASTLRRTDGEALGYLYLLRSQPRTFERPHYQAFLDASCLASEYLTQSQALQRAVQVEARLLPYESGVESLTDAVLTFNGAATVTYANSAAEQLFGAPAAKLQGQPLTALIPGGPDVLPAAADTWQLGHAEGRTQGGETLHLDVASRRLQVDGTSCTLLIRDVSGQHADVAALAQSQLHAQALIQAIPDSLFVLSKEGVVQSYKPDSLRLERDPVGRSVYQLWPLDTAEQIMLYLRLTLQGTRRSRAFPLKSPGGARGERQLEGRITPMGSERALLVVSDLSLDGRLEGTARHSLALMEASADGVALFDPQWRCWYANPTLIDRLGYRRPEDVVGKNWHALFPEGDRETVAGGIEDALSRRDHWNGQVDLRRADGSVARQELAISAFKEGNSILVAHDLAALADVGFEPEGDELLREARGQDRGASDSERGN